LAKMLKHSQNNSALKVITLTKDQWQYSFNRISLEMAVFWVVAPCSLVEIYQRDELWAMSHRPDDGGSKVLWNAGKFLPDYTALKPRRQPSSYQPPWGPQILLRISLVICQTTCIGTALFSNSNTDQACIFSFEVFSHFNATQLHSEWLIFWNYSMISFCYHCSTLQN
jgi:hypothetical protein